MLQNFCRWILYKKLGWKKDITVDLPEKYIICLAPHTSNWDLFLGQAFAKAEGMKSNFLMKKEWFLLASRSYFPQDGWYSGLEK